MYNLEENKMYLENIDLHLRCNAEKVIYMASPVISQKIVVCAGPHWMRFSDNG